eukprot:CAMPEP_0202979304 /NCGR_PEP_ID=MMETSP1396-20130829/85492_1 /ASSEMBLY_ACC=CAM_ASM_000872 /TAXON_ID= /ORGANISM="Pseudokeronopsis sp., Strain Brazil" /LENGTH=74 /DNA_ID=CAMNT_0049718671 /DNA_START=936 /DNA_END=1157 /DNA_ORIENTATION=-
MKRNYDAEMEKELKRMITERKAHLGQEKMEEEDKDKYPTLFLMSKMSEMMVQQAGADKQLFYTKGPMPEKPIVP